MEKEVEKDGFRLPYREGTPLKNPLPTPRRKKHMPMDYDFEPDHDGVQDEFDFDIFPCDDFDIT